MVDQLRMLVFGDLTFDYEADIRRHVVEKGNPLLVALSTKSHVPSVHIWKVFESVTVDTRASEVHHMWVLP